MAFQKEIKGDEKWNEEINESPGGLQVVEVFQEWCGPAKSLEATLKRFYFDNSSKSIGFFRASSKAVKDLNKYTDICEPVFLFYIKGKMEGEVVGCDLPKLTSVFNELVQRPEVEG